MKKIIVAVFLLAGFLSSSDSHALISCAPIINNWYCGDSKTMSPPVPYDVGSHGSGYYCWCYSGNGWRYGSDMHDSTTSVCPLRCPGRCDA
jgi:hypothetical protein